MCAAHVFTEAVCSHLWRFFASNFSRFHTFKQTKTLPVEVEPNYDKASDRTEVIERFVRSLANPETRNPNFNLRLRFRDRKMLQELGLDDGESLEFDLDIYKAEDQDIPDLINSLVRCLFPINISFQWESLVHCYGFFDCSLLISTE